MYVYIYIKSVNVGFCRPYTQNITEHAKRCSRDSCQQVIRSNFYVIRDIFLAKLQEDRKLLM